MPLVLEPRLAKVMVRLDEVAAPSDVRFSLEELSGRMVELRQRGAALTFAFSLITEAQQRSELCAYVSGRARTFFPPDVEAGGVDLAALPVVFADEAAARVRAADELLRSGAFSLVVVDLLGETGHIGPALLTRLHGLVQKHHSAVLFLTEESQAPLGSLVSLRAVARREPHDRTRCRVVLEVVKDKRRAAGWSAELVRLLPPGLR